MTFEGVGMTFEGTGATFTPREGHLQRADDARHGAPAPYTVATAVAGEPTAPGRRSGGAVSRKPVRQASRR